MTLNFFSNQDFVTVLGTSTTKRSFSWEMIKVCLNHVLNCGLLSKISISPRAACQSCWWVIGRLKKVGTSRTSTPYHERHEGKRVGLRNSVGSVLITVP